MWKKLSTITPVVLQQTRKARIAPRLSNLLGGRIAITSTSGLGSTFELIVPLRLEVTEAVKPEATASASTEAA